MPVPTPAELVVPVFRSLLALILADITDADLAEHRDYAKRNRMIFDALFYASCAGYKVGIRFDWLMPLFPVVAYIELPTGQVSWHLPLHIEQWDGHTISAKYERIRDFIRTADLQGDGDNG